MKLPVSWLRDFVDVPADPSAVAARLGACGFAVESVEGDVIDLEITANRPDCLSVYGLARETATAFGVALGPAAGTAAPRQTTGLAPIKVSVGDTGCARYALAVAEVTVAPSPAWLAARLIAAGVRPINNVVDVTNYVMIEMGHPMHAFDTAKLAGEEIRVRRARAGEALTTLDGQQRTLDDTMLVIADRERAVALAGVMGGAASEVSRGTTRIALESAWFVPTSIRATSRKVGLKTEASARFERGADLTAPVEALHRALALLERIDAGRGVGGVTDVYPRPAAPRTVTLGRAHVTRLLGTAVPDTEVERILTQLGFGVSARPDGWQIAVPLFRVDVTREADLIEEIGRHWGFDRVPATFPALASAPGASTPSVMRGRLLRRVLSGAGLQEAVTFTFISDAAAGPFAPIAERIAIKNPLSEKFAWLRPSLAPGLIDSLLYNRNRQTEDIRLFEVGTTFSRTRGERACVGWVLTGARHRHWSTATDAIDFSDAKGVADLVVAALGGRVELEATTELSWLVPGRAARLTTPSGVVGWVGQLVATDAADVIFGGEIDLAALSTSPSATTPRIQPLPTQPSIIRDLSIVVDERLPAADVRGTIRSHAPPTLIDVQEFDRYQGKGVQEGRVSLSVRLTFRAADRTLTDAEVQPAIDHIVQALLREHGATLRGA